MVGLEGVEPPA